MADILEAIHDEEVELISVKIEVNLKRKAAASTVGQQPA